MAFEDKIKEHKTRKKSRSHGRLRETETSEEDRCSERF